MTVPIVKLRTEAGTVWESDEKRFVQLGDHHWCGTNNEPEPVDDSTIEHVCRIWRVSEDQAWTPPKPPAPESQNPIDQLIERVQLTGGDLEGANIPVLAMLYQARALEKIAEAADEWLKSRRVGIDELLPLPRFGEGFMQHRGGSTPLQTESGGSGGGDFTSRLCEHPVKDVMVIVTASGFTRPVVNGDYCTPIGASKEPHRFQGSDSLMFCTQCGGGRLHPIHQV